MGNGFEDFVSAPGRTLPTGQPNLTLLEILQLRQELLSATPYTTYEYVNVSFTAADTDKDIRHNLRPADPEGIHYQVVRRDRNTTIYHNQTGTRREWGAGYIVLRSSAASANVTLLLFTPRTP